MKKLIIILSAFLLCSCASNTIIKTIPDGVRVKQENKLKGVTPYEYYDRGLSFTSETFILQKEGYKDTEITIKKNVFYFSRVFWLPVLSWPWMFGYDDQYYFELEKSEKPNQ